MSKNINSNTKDSTKEKTNSAPPVQPNKMYTILMQQHANHVKRGIAMAKLSPQTKRGEAHPASKYTEAQIATAKAMYLAFLKKDLRVSYAAIAGVTGMKISSIRALFKKVRPSWSHVIPEQWEIDSYANQLDLVRLSKLEYRKAQIQERDESISTQKARIRMAQGSVWIVDTGNLAVDEIYTTILKTLGRKPETFDDFLQQANDLVKTNRLDRLWFKRLQRSLIENRNNLYPTNQ